MINCKCLNDKFTVKRKGTQNGLYCSECGKWVKWCKGSEIDILRIKGKIVSQNVIEYTDTDNVTSYSTMIDSNIKEKLICVNDKIEYFYYEWLICEKNIDREHFDNLTKEEITKLRKEFVNIYFKLH